MKVTARLFSKFYSSGSAARKCIKIFAQSKLVSFQRKKMEHQQQCLNCKRSVKDIAKHNCAKCKTCNRYFVSMKRHKCLYRQCASCLRIVRITSIHNCSGKRLLECKKCGFKTPRHEKMVEHRKNGHCYTCPKCDYKTPIYRLMRQHYHRCHQRYRGCSSRLL